MRNCGSYPKPVGRVDDVVRYEFTCGCGARSIFECPNRRAKPDKPIQLEYTNGAGHDARKAGYRG